jgi:putative spermidine/putrescine transport system permease protein
VQSATRIEANRGIPTGWGRRRAWALADRGALLVVPAVAFLGVFFVYPVVEVMRRSATDFYAGDKAPLGNYSWFFGNHANVVVLQRTFLTALIVTAVCLLLAYPYAYLMTVVGPRWRMVMLAALLIPFGTSLMVRDYAWVLLLQDHGIINDGLAAVGIGRVSLLYTSKGVVIGMSQILLPFMALPLYNTLRGIDRRLLAAATSLGARPTTAFLRVYLPLSLPGVLAGCLLVFVLALGFYLAPALLGSPRQTLLSQLIIVQVSKLLAWGRGGAMAAVLLVLTLVLIGVASLFSRRARRYGTARAPEVI